MKDAVSSSLVESPNWSAHPAYDFGPFRVDTAERLLFHGSQRVDVRGKAFDVLLTLLRSEGNALSKEALMLSVWAESSVEEANLTVAISQLRKALREAGSDREYIETLAGRGYRFLRSGVSSKQSHQSSTRLRTVHSPPQSKPVPNSTPFVGRESELNTLERVAGEVRAGGHGAVFLIGEAGIGKTALIETFLAKLVREDELWVARGTCIKLFGAGEPYLPVLGALRGSCRGAEGIRRLDVLKQVAPTWAAQLPELLTDSELGELGRRSTSHASTRRMLSELGAFVEKLSSERGLVWCFEDLHWADPSTLELLAYLTRRSDLPGTLIIASLRPPEQSESSSALAELCSGRFRSGKTLRLQPLTSAQVAQYLDARFAPHDFPVALAHLVHERTLGSPLFLAQSADAWLDAGLVRRSDGVWSLTVELQQVGSHLPDTTAQTIETQVDRLAPGARNLLDAISVCGERFAVAAVAHMLQQDPVEVERSCLVWCRQGRFVRVLGEVEWPNGTKTTVCSLSHALYREVLYRRLGAANRARLHLRLAESLERAYGTRTAEIATELALHFERASEPARAARYLRAVAETALERCAYASAITSLERGLALLASAREVPNRLRLELDLQAALASARAIVEGHASTAVQQANERVLQLANALDDASLSALFGAWMSLFIQAQYAAADALATELAQRAERQRDRALAAGASVMAGLCSLYRGRLRTARQQLEFGLRSLDNEQRAFEWISDALDPCIVAYNLCWALWSEGLPDTALVLVKRGLASARINERPYFLAYLMHFAGVVHELRGEYAEALQQALALQVLCDKHHFGFFTPLARYQEAVQRSYLGEPGATDEIEHGISNFRNTGSEVAASRPQALLAEALIADGRYERAAAALRVGFELVIANDEHFWESELHRLQGEVWIHLAREGKSAAGCDLGASGADSPEACLFKSLRVAQAQGALSLELRAALSLARLLQHGPRRFEARTLLARVYEQFFEGFETRELIEARDMLNELNGPTSS